MQKISLEESRNLAANLITGMQNTLLISLENSGEHQVNSIGEENQTYFRQGHSFIESSCGSFFQNRFQNTCSAQSSSCPNDDYEKVFVSSTSSSNDGGAAGQASDNCIFGNAMKSLPMGMANPNSNYAKNVNGIKNVSEEEEEHTYNENDLSRKYGKKCPQCLEINDKDANWCMECGKAIISVEIRRFQSLKEERLDLAAPSASQSVPVFSVYKNSISYEDEISPSLMNTATGQFIYYGPQPSNKGLDDCYSAFDFDDPKFDDEEEISTLKHRRSVNDYERRDAGVKKFDTPHLYAFDDLLYPNHAIQDPVNGFILPSSHIVSDAAYYQPQYLYQKDQRFFPEDQVVPRRKKSSKKQKNKKNRSRKQQINFQNAELEGFSTIKDTTLNLDLLNIMWLFGRKLKSVVSTVRYLYSSLTAIENGRWYLINLVKHADTTTTRDLLLLNLPEEVILHILSKLKLTDIVKCARVCKSLHRITSDISLWKVIKIKKKHDLTDHILSKIARKRPSTLSITQCNGKELTVDGMRNLFRLCAESLQELDISTCSGGVLVGETVLLHVSARCKNIYKLDVSWSNVSNIGVQSVCSALKRIVEISLNGCQGITDDAVQTLAEKHGKTLEAIELFGCFNVTPSSIAILAEHCKGLKKLNLGQCHKINGFALSNIAKNLKELQTLDIRGCKQIRDAAFKEIVANCQELNNIVIANCPLITDQSLISIANSLPKLKCLDACGCNRVTDRGVYALARSCFALRMIDMSSTKVTGKSVSAIGNYCYKSLVSLKLSFCHSITDHCLHIVVNKCKKLTILHLYGCKPVRNLHKLMEMNPSLKIEKESLRLYTKVSFGAEDSTTN